MICGRTFFPSIRKRERSHAPLFWPFCTQTTFVLLSLFPKLEFCFLGSFFKLGSDHWGQKIAGSWKSLPSRHNKYASCISDYVGTFFQQLILFPSYVFKSYPLEFSFTSCFCMPSTHFFGYFRMGWTQSRRVTFTFVILSILLIQDMMLSFLSLLV